MTQIKIGDKTLIIEDGVNVEMAGDEIRVKPGTSAPQPVFIPSIWPSYPYRWGQPYYTYDPILGPNVVYSGSIAVSGDASPTQ